MTSASGRDGLHADVHGDGPLVFLHIPKTGGGTLGPWLQLHCRPGAFFRVGNAISKPDEFEARVPILAGSPAVEVVAGHFPYGVHERFPRPARYLTLLRDPVDRVLSHYHHLMKIVPPGTTGPGLEPHWLPPPPPDLSLPDCLVEGGYIPPDLQTRMICGVRSFEEPLPDDALEQAKRNLSERFAFVGTIERLDEFLARVNIGLGWPTLVYRRGRTNPMRSPREAISPEVLRVVEERNALDAELYRHGNELLDRALERVGKRELGLELEVIRRAQAAAAGNGDVPAQLASDSCTPEVGGRVRLALSETRLLERTLELEDARARIDELAETRERQAERIRVLQARAEDYREKLRAAREERRGSLTGLGSIRAALGRARRR